MNDGQYNDGMANQFMQSGSMAAEQDLYGLKNSDGSMMPTLKRTNSFDDLNADGNVPYVNNIWK
jgi:hypothetical protein